MRLSLSHLKVIDDDCSKLLAIYPVLSFSLYGVNGVICTMKVFKEVKHVVYENVEQQRP